jgi:hypothetical protein
MHEKILLKIEVSEYYHVHEARGSRETGTGAFVFAGWISMEELQ